jgi:hypothetical protein
MLTETDFMTIEQLKENKLWVMPWISGKDLPDLILKLGQEVRGIEIGVCRGENICYCLERCENLKKIVAIDPYLPYEDWNLTITKEIIEKFYEIAKLNFSTFDDRIEFVRNTSDNVHKTLEDCKYDYIFIDGEHTYSAVLQDLKNYYNKIRLGGVVSGHDANLQQVLDAVNDFRDKEDITAELKFCNTNVWYWIKNED